LEIFLLEVLQEIVQQVVQVQREFGRETLVQRKALVLVKEKAHVLFEVVKQNFSKNMMLEVGELRGKFFEIDEEPQVEMSEEMICFVQEIIVETLLWKASEEIVGEKVEEIVGEKVEEMVEEMVEGMVEEKVEEMVEEKVGEMVEEKIEEKVEGDVVEKIEELAEGRIVEKIWGNV